MSSSKYAESANKFIITTDDYNGINKQFVVSAHNGVSLGFIVTLWDQFYMEDINISKDNGKITHIVGNGKNSFLELLNVGTNIFFNIPNLVYFLIS